MMGKVSTGGSFRESLHYCLEDKKQTQTQQVIVKDRAEVISFHRCHGNKDELSRQVREVTSIRKDISKPVMHISLSMPPDEPLAKSQLVQLGKECAEHMSLDKNQYVVILHKDTSHQHIHLVANRIGFDGHCVSDSFDQRRVNEYCRAAEVRHGLTRTLNPMRYRTEEERLIPRQDIKLDQLKENIRQSLLLSRDIPAFKAQMEERGYTVYHNQKGMAFLVDRYVVFRGYEACYPFSKIQSILSQELALRQQQERQRLAEVLRQQQEQELSQRQALRRHHQIQSQELSL